MLQGHATKIARKIAGRIPGEIALKKMKKTLICRIIAIS